MALLGIVLAAIGAGDVLRLALPSRIPASARIAVHVLVGAVLLALALLADAAPWWMLVLAVVPVLMWRHAVRIAPAAGETDAGGASPSRPGMLLLTLALITALGVAAWLMTGDRIGTPVQPQPTAEVPLLAAGLALFLMVSSNALVRAALDHDVPRTRPVHSSDPPILAPLQLKGGRWIGPLERLTLVALLVAGAFPVAAGVIAAKGIVRFPEVQADSSTGNKAEYFLVGSLVSWTLAIIAAGLLWLTADIPLHRAAGMG